MSSQHHHVGFRAPLLHIRLPIKEGEACDFFETNFSMNLNYPSMNCLDCTRFRNQRHAWMIRASPSICWTMGPTHRRMCKLAFNKLLLVGILFSTIQYPTFLGLNALEL